MKVTERNAAGRRDHEEGGFSLIELLIVMALLIIMTVIGVSALIRSRELSVTDDQAIKILEAFRQARQIALTKRRAVRVELCPANTDEFIRIIDTNTAAGAGDDQVVAMFPAITAPVSASVDLPSPVALPFPAPAAPDTYPQVVNFTQPSHPHPSVPTGNVWAVVFLSNGMMVDSATAGLGSVPVPLMATLVVQNPAQGNSSLRAITFFGGSSSAKVWKYTGGSQCGNDRPAQNGWCN